MKLTGLYIVVNGKKKFIAKVGNCPYSDTVPLLKNHCIMYREALWKDCVSYATSTLGIDYACYLRAKELGSEGCVTYMSDTRQMVTISNEVIEESGFNLALGDGTEGVQKRISITHPKIKIYENAIPIKLGYIPENACEIIPEITHNSFTEATDNPKQQELFT